MNRQIIASLCVLLTLNACASYPSNIKAAYVSPTTYSALQCEEIAAERTRVDAELAKVEKEQRSQANTDTAMMTLGMLIAWPVLLGFAFPDNDRPEEVARLKGEAQAVKESYAAHGCGNVQTAVATPAPVPAAAPGAPAAPAPKPAASQAPARALAPAQRCYAASAGTQQCCHETPDGFQQCATMPIPSAQRYKPVSAIN